MSDPIYSNYWVEHEEDPWVEVDPFWVEELYAAGGGFIQVPLQRVPFHMDPPKPVKVLVQIAATITSSSVCYGVITGRAYLGMSTTGASSLQASLSHNEKGYTAYRRRKDEDALVLERLI